MIRVGNLEKLYHSSTAKAINDIQKNGFKKVTPWPRNLNFLTSKKKTNYLGNFGIGTYAFLNNPELSVLFIMDELQYSHNQDYGTIEFELKKNIIENDKERKTNILDLRPSTKDLAFFKRYLDKYHDAIDYVLENFKEVNGRSNVKLAGAIVEYFIWNHLKDEDGNKIPCDAVYGASVTNDVFNLGIPDGVECCIRNIKTIDNNSIRLYTSNERSWL